MRILLIILFIASSCAYRTKGIVGIKETSSDPSTIAFATDAKIHYPDYVGERQKERLRFFETNDEADYIINKLDYERAPMSFFCATGLPLPFLVSFVTLGMVPLHITDELVAKMEVTHRVSGRKKIIKLEAKTTSSWSLWNRIKTGRDPEWSRKDESGADYFRDYIRSKVLR